MGILQPTWRGVLGACLLVLGPVSAGARAQSGFFGGSTGRLGGYRASAFNTTYGASSAYGSTSTAANYFGHRLYGPAGGYGSRSFGGYATGGYSRPAFGGYATGGLYSGLSSYGGYPAGGRSFTGYSTGGLTSGLAPYRGSAVGSRTFGGYASGGNSLVSRGYGGYSTGGSLLRSGANYGGTAAYSGSMMQRGGGMPAAPAGGFPRSMTSLGGLPH